jgi:hypothetical protein
MEQEAQNQKIEEAAGKFDASDEEFLKHLSNDTIEFDDGNGKALSKAQEELSKDNKELWNDLVMSAKEAAEKARAEAKLAHEQKDMVFSAQEYDLWIMLSKAIRLLDEETKDPENGNKPIKDLLNAKDGQFWHDYFPEDINEMPDISINIYLQHLRNQKQELENKFQSRKS